MADVEAFEVLIVGGGKAGKTLAADLARSGRRVALVERGMIDGTCINVGRIPSNALIRSAAVARRVGRAAEFGIAVERWKSDMPAVLARKRTVVAGMVDVNWSTLHGALGASFILGEARFVAPRAVDVRPAEGGPARRIVGDKLFINLGARAVLPDLPGLADARPLTSEPALELDRLPEHLLVLGGGYIGVELGQAFLDDYRIGKANVFGDGGRSASDRLIPHTVFIDPELGRVGLSERAARAAGHVGPRAERDAAVDELAQRRGGRRGLGAVAADERLAREGHAVLHGHAAPERFDPQQVRVAERLDVVERPPGL
jgi:pyruvate/2-oxoglutarate dehydrogenase complex dihydrolipoamide dehydrogenase (E3) component